MSVYYPHERDERTFPRAAACSECGEPVGADECAVYWAFRSAELILHAGCASALGAHLIGDAREARLAGGGHPWPLHARAVLRHRLHAVEMRP